MKVAAKSMIAAVFCLFISIAGFSQNLESIGGGYAKSSFDVYYEGREIKDASVTSFKYLGYGYAKDAFNVYYHGRVIKDASVTSFTILKDGYAKDAFNTYYCGKKQDPFDSFDHHDDHHHDDHHHGDHHHYDHHDAHHHGDRLGPLQDGR